MPATRQLAAIMFTDIVGYTALMGEDSVKALRVQKIAMGIQKPLVEKHNGKWLKEMGDGALASFNSALDAVNCSLEIQQSAKEKLDNKLRIGIHLGDVTVEENDVHGDGVNVASRLESVADPGGIYISESIQKAIQGLTDVQVKYLGEIKLKNVVYGVRTYALQGVGLPVPEVKDEEPTNSSLWQKTQKTVAFQAVLFALVLVLATIYFYQKYFKEGGNMVSENHNKSIAVLPFADMSQGGDQQFFADGVMEDILGQLQRIGELRVVSRTSVMVYRDNKPTIRQVRDELNVDYVLEGSVRKSPDEVMITAQLINVADDSHLFSENYISDYSAKGIFEIQGKIAKKIVGDLKLTISPEKMLQITESTTESTQAYEYFHKARDSYVKFTDPHMDSAIIELKKAVKIDPRFASAYGLMANAFWLKNVNYDASKTFIDSAEVYAKKGLEFNDNCAECYKALAGVEDSKYGNVVKALELYEMALEINPNHTGVMYNMITRYARLGEYEKRYDMLSRLMKVTPEGTIRILYLVSTYIDMGDIRKAKSLMDALTNSVGGMNKLEWFHSSLYAEIQFHNGDLDGFKIAANRTIQFQQDSLWIYYTVLSTSWLEKKYDVLTSYYEEYHREIWDSFKINRSLVGFSYIRLGKYAEADQIGSSWLASLENENKSSAWITYDMALAHLLMDQKDQSINWLEKSIDLGYLRTDISKDAFLASLKDHPGFQELVDKQHEKRREVMALMATYDFPEPEDF